jgi:hypothetical protein
MDDLTRMKSLRTEPDDDRRRQHNKWAAFLKRLNDEPSIVFRDVLCIQACSVLRGSISGLRVDNDLRVLPEIKEFHHDVVKGREGTAAAWDAARQMDLIRKPYDTPGREQSIIGQAAEDTDTPVRNTRLRRYFGDKRHEEQRATKPTEWWNKL